MSNYNVTSNRSQPTFGTPASWSTPAETFIPENLNNNVADATMLQESFEPSSATGSGVYSKNQLQALFTPGSETSEIQGDEKEKKKKTAGKDETKIIKDVSKVYTAIKQATNGEATAKRAEAERMKTRKQLQKFESKVNVLDLEGRRPPLTTDYQTELSKQQAAANTRSIDKWNRQVDLLGIGSERAPQRSFVEQAVDDARHDVIKKQNVQAGHAADIRFKKTNQLNIGGEPNPSTKITSTNAGGPGPSNGAVARNLAGKVANTVMGGPANMAFGFVDVTNGIERIRNGDTEGGALQTAKGGGSVVSGAITTGGVVASGLQMLGAASKSLTTSAAILSTAAKGLPVIGAATGGVDGVMNIVDGVKKDNVENATLGTLKVAGAVMSVLPGGIVPAVVLVGMVTAYENREAITNIASSAGNYLSKAFSSSPQGESKNTPASPRRETTVSPLIKKMFSQPQSQPQTDFEVYAPLPNLVDSIFLNESADKRTKLVGPRNNSTASSQSKPVPSKPKPTPKPRTPEQQKTSELLRHTPRPTIVNILEDVADGNRSLFPPNPLSDAKRRITRILVSRGFSAEHLRVTTYKNFDGSMELQARINNPADSRHGKAWSFHMSNGKITSEKALN